jgi:hypothetical protein
MFVSHALAPPRGHAAEPPVNPPFTLHGHPSHSYSNKLLRGTYINFLYTTGHFSNISNGSLCILTYINYIYILMNVIQKYSKQKHIRISWSCSLRGGKMTSLIINDPMLLQLDSKHEVNSVTALETLNFGHPHTSVPTEKLLHTSRLMSHRTYCTFI